MKAANITLVFKKDDHTDKENCKQFTILPNLSNVLESCIYNKCHISVSISEKMLTLKLTTLFALTAAYRVSEITNLDINFLAKHQTCSSFAFSKVSKSWKKGRVPNIDEYLKRTEVRRNDHGHHLLGLIKHHKPFTSSKVSRWIVDMIGQSGVDTDVFKTYSTRSAATSKASSTGVFLTEIIKRGQCSSTTFKKFYHKEIVNREMFQNIINSASALQEKLLVAMRVCFC